MVSPQEKPEQRPHPHFETLDQPSTQSLGFFSEDAKDDTILDRIGDPSHQTNLFPHIKQNIAIDIPAGVYA
jgi:hypothetical protein